MSTTDQPSDRSGGVPMTRKVEHLFVNARTSSFECSRCGNRKAKRFPK